jgi:type I restriction enzyme M protein
MNKYETINGLMEALGYISEDDEYRFAKKFEDHEYSITVDLKKGKILYPKPIQLGDDTTGNFSHPENLVVLECVDRLLRKGYRPQDLHLEKKWSLGRTQKGGKADILITGSDSKTLLIIECKTWGDEYEKEKRRMQSGGGQLFTYRQQELSARYLCLYTSTIENGQVRYENAIVRIEDDDKLKKQFDGGNEEIRLYENAKTVEELHQVWKENYSCYFHPNGIFEDDVQPYQIDLKPLKIKDLKTIKDGDGGFIHNQFAEILRHNNISDKENAFNKMISLFLCKVVDESKSEDEVVDFQWERGD